MKCLLPLAGAALVLLLVASCQSGPKYVGVYGKQAELQVTRLPDTPAKLDREKIIAAAKAFWKPTEDYWPEPDSIDEFPDCWQVGFCRKMKLYSIDGKEYIEKPTPAGRWLRVNKADYSCSDLPTK